MFGNNTNRVTNPFGQTSTVGGLFGSTAGSNGSGGFGVFGASNQSAGGFGAFGSQPTGGGVFGSQPGGMFQQPQRISANFQQQSMPSKGGKGKGGKGQTPSTSSSMAMADDTSTSTGRVTNPFASSAKSATSITYEEAVHQYKTDVLRKKGYPFSCLGLPDESPVILGDISPEELRWYLSQSDFGIQKLIAERSNLLGNVDFTDFLRGASCDGAVIQIQRVGPYRISDPQFPAFVPRGTFKIVGDGYEISPTGDDVAIFKAQVFENRIPRCPPPLEYR